MLALADTVVLSTGWTRRLIAFLAGAFGALALAPLNAGPALIVPLSVAVWLIDGSVDGAPPGTIRRWLRGVRLAFGAGWWLGFGYFVAGFWWLSSAFLIDPEFTWALPLGVVGLPALLAIFMGAGFAISRALWSSGPARLLALALGLGFAEWMRGHLFTGFPWNPLGMGLGGNILTAQPAALVGLDGLNILTVALFAAPATLADGLEQRLNRMPTIIALCAFAMLAGFGGYRLLQTRPPDVPNVVVRIMQPGLRPDEKFNYENRDQIVSRYIDLSKTDDTAKGVKLDDVTMLVWPESAFPFILGRDAEELQRIGSFLPKTTSLVTGAARQEDIPGKDGRPGRSVYFNAIQVVASGGAIIDLYDKVHLVPFGEFLPFGSLLGKLGLRHFVDVPGGFEPGHVRGTLSIPGMPPASPLICYEAIFPGEVLASRESPSSGARFLLNVTNDGWFGLTTGPWQHLAQARLRTIEEGLPMIRGAATGISAIIDPYGRILSSLPLGAEGILDGLLPQPIAPPLFARIRSEGFWVLWLATLCGMLALRATSTSRR